MRKLVGILVCVAALAGCAEFSQLRDFTIADAKQAQQWAIEDKDMVAALCYGALIAFGYTIDTKKREPIGVLSAEYLARHVRRKIDGLENSEAVQKLKIGCAPLLLEKEELAVKLGLKLF
jgi:hypothetical protein